MNGPANSSDSRGDGRLVCEPDPSAFGGQDVLFMTDATFVIEKALSLEGFGSSYGSFVNFSGEQDD